MTRGIPTPDALKQQVRHLWEVEKLRPQQIADRLGITIGQVNGLSTRLHLHYDGVQRPLKPGSRHDVAAISRFRKAAVEHPGDYGVLKKGRNQRKLGERVLKGPWKGLPIYSLTLEERATCPRYCGQWLTCYGNQMGRAVRYRHGAQLEAAILLDLLGLDRRHPGGFVVRLHILGDFYSVGYVDFWRICLDDFPGLRVFGYTARRPSEPIGHEIAKLRDERWDRFAIRTSHFPSGPRTWVIEKPEDAPADAIICPAQTGGASHCGACALCWAPAAKHRPIAFLQH